MLKLEMIMHLPEEELPPIGLKILIIKQDSTELIGKRIHEFWWESQMVGDLEKWSMDKGGFHTREVYCWGSFNSRKYV